jgi:8-oxo-dGTP diphosphatase
MQAPAQRRSARAILLDQAGRVLLIRFSVPREGQIFVFWATPGGGVEVGETDCEAARREIKEELAVNVELAGPVHTSEDRFTHNGVMVEMTDVFFVGRHDQEALQLHGIADNERAAMQETRWWSSEEIEQTTETIFPRDLSAAIRRIA